MNFTHKLQRRDNDKQRKLRKAAQSTRSSLIICMILRRANVRKNKLYEYAVPCHSLLAILVLLASAPARGAVAGRLIRSRTRIRLVRLSGTATEYCSAVQYGLAEP